MRSARCRAILLTTTYFLKRLNVILSMHWIAGVVVSFLKVLSISVRHARTSGMEGSARNIWPRETSV